MDEALKVAWGRVGTALEGAAQARKYEDYEQFLDRWNTVVEQVEALKRAQAEKSAQ